MTHPSRRNFLRLGAAGLSAGAGGLVLARAAEPTPASGALGDYGLFLAQRGESSAPASRDLVPTEDNILGPYYRPAAPYRAKITPPGEPGTILVVSGRVWGHDTGRPLPMATIDIWQANATGRYDNDDPTKGPAKDVFLNRARLVTDEKGYYEYETVHPGRYQIGRDMWRPSHVHYLVQHPGYRKLVTQLYFRGDPMNKSDRFIKASLIIDVETAKGPGGEYERGSFDIVLAAA